MLCPPFGRCGKKALVSGLRRSNMLSECAPDQQGKLAALVNNAGISPKREGGSRLGVADTTAEVAQTIYFLCSEESSYINGAEILINGGQHV